MEQTAFCLDCGTNYAIHNGDGSCSFTQEEKVLGIYEELKEKSLPFIQAYHDDLLVHDKHDMLANPGREFLHFTGKCGTHLIMLLEYEDYPKKDELVPYLFSHADRWHILKSVSVQVDCMKNCQRTALILHFDGKKLEEITLQKAKDIARDYTEKMGRRFKV